MPTSDDSVLSARLVEHVFPRLREDLVNLDKYMDSPPEAVHVKPVDQWTEQVVARFNNAGQYLGHALPWGKLSGLFGIRPQELTIWAGPGGTGKSMLTSQVALRLAQAGDRICIASLEMPPVMTAYRIARQCLAGDPAFEEDVREYLKQAGKFIWLYEQTGTAHWRRILALARYCASELKITQFFVDSLMKCGIAKDDYNSQIAFVDALSALAKDTCLHIHLITHTRKGETTARSQENQDVRGASEITDLADNVMMLSRNLAKEQEREEVEPDRSVMLEPDAKLVCSKNRYGEWQGLLKLWYHPNAMSFLDSPEALPLRLFWAPEREPGCDDDRETKT